MEGFVLTVGAKFAAHLNSYSQPSAKLVVLFSNTGDSLDAAFVKKNSVPHGSLPRISVGDAVTRSFESSTRGAAFRDLNVCPRTPKITEQCGRF